LKEQRMSQQLQTILDAAWEDRANISIQSAPKEVADAVEHVIAQLNNGTLRVATRDGVGQWTTHQWIKKAVLLSFRLKDNRVMKSGDLAFYDKVDTKFGHMTEAELKASGVRVVPPAVARRGSFVAAGAILMPRTSTSARMSIPARWWTPGLPWVLAHKLVRTFTYQAALALAACWSRCKPARPLLKTTVLSALVRK